MSNNGPSNSNTDVNSNTANAALTPHSIPLIASPAGVLVTSPRTGRLRHIPRRNPITTPTPALINGHNASAIAPDDQRSKKYKR